MRYNNSLHFFFAHIWYHQKKYWPKKYQQLKQSKNKKKYSLIALFFVVAVVFIFSSIGLLAYRQPTDSKTVNAVIKIFPYPAAIVNGNIITLYDWQYEYFAWKKASELQGSQVTASQIKSDVLNKLIYDKVLFDFAQKHDIEVSEEELDYELINLAKQDFGSIENFEQEIKATFGWGLEEFKARILYNSIISQKLGEIYNNDENNLTKAREQAEDILAQLKNGEDFASLARQYSLDPGSAEAGGNLGWFGRGIMVKEFEEAAFSLAVGQISDIVQTDYGFHLLLLEDKVDKSDKSEEEVNVSHILISPETFQSVLDKTVDEARVIKFIKI